MENIYALCKYVVKTRQIRKYFEVFDFCEWEYIHTDENSDQNSDKFMT
jgi:hypothetical protein